MKKGERAIFRIPPDFTYGLWGDWVTIRAGKQVSQIHFGSTHVGRKLKWVGLI